MTRAAAITTGLALLLAGCNQVDAPSDQTSPSEQTSETDQTSPSDQTSESRDWTPIEAGPLSPRTGSVGAWTGSELLVIGGVDWICPLGADCPGPSDDDYLVDGAAYDPTTDTWRALPDAPRETFVDLGVWTGTELVILHHPAGFEAGDTRLPGAVTALDPTTNAWRTLDPPPVDHLTGGVWTGEDLLFWQGEDTTSTIHVLDPESGSWSTLPQDPLGPSFDRSVSWLSDSVYLVGLRMEDTREPKQFVLTVLDPEAETWSEPVDIPVAFWAQAWFAFDDQLVNASQEAMGAPEPGRTPIHGAFDPATRRWSPVPQVDSHEDLVEGCQVPTVGPAGDWLAPGGSVLISLEPPQAITMPPCTSLPDPSVGAWTGTEFLVWGGIDPTGEANSSIGVRWSPPRP